MIKIPYSKTTGFKGKVVDIFPLRSDSKCPVCAIKKLKVLATRKGVCDNNSPVFSFGNKKNLTKEKLNGWLRNLLSDFVDEEFKITVHSFWAAIPTAMASFPDMCSTRKIMEWGNWESNSFRLYTRDEREKKRVFFGKIVECLKYSTE